LQLKPGSSSERTGIGPVPVRIGAASERIAEMPRKVRDARPVATTAAARRLVWFDTVCSFELRWDGGRKPHYY
jgi:hypothetical protein